MPKEAYNEKLLEWIRTLPCIECEGWTMWDDKLGRPISDASHVLAKGFNKKHGDENNVVPHCRPCHKKHEKRNPEEQAKLLPIASKLTQTFFDLYPEHK